MQKGEGLHRGGRGLRRTLAVVAVSIVMASAGGAEAQRLWSDPPFMEAGGGISAARGKGAGLTMSLLAASPYGLEDLRVGSVETRLRTCLVESGLSWRMISHPLYREDRISALVALRHRSTGISCGVVPVVELRAAEGFVAERAIATLVYLSWCGRVASARLLLSPGAPEGRKRGPAICCAGGRGRVRGGALVHTADDLVSETRLFASYVLGGSASLQCSYALRARELWSAFAFERRGFRASAAWGVNSALGSSACVELGRRWSW